MNKIRVLLHDKPEYVSNYVLHSLKHHIIKLCCSASQIFNTVGCCHYNNLRFSTLGCVKLTSIDSLPKIECRNKAIHNLSSSFTKVTSVFMD